MGGKESAGIGCSGDTSEITNQWTTSTENISITDNSVVTAVGGSGGAGIGAGTGGRINGDIIISDSTVTATGGEKAAGIGGGANGWGGRGANIDELSITGKSKVTATGGSGGAGIGGGFEGDAEDLRFSLTQTADNAYYVYATGGNGAAGIGGGGSDASYTSLTNKEGGDIGSVIIEGGHIVARGGSSGKGSGAGIGGGRKGSLNNLCVTGGFVEAYAGGSSAFDIGHGGSDSPDFEFEDGAFAILGGTVIAANSVYYFQSLYYTRNIGSPFVYSVVYYYKSIFHSYLFP